MAKKNLFKKIASVAMAGALTLSMALPVGAATNDPNFTTYNTAFSVPFESGKAVTLKVGPANSHYSYSGFDTASDAVNKLGYSFNAGADKIASVKVESEQTGDTYASKLTVTGASNEYGPASIHAYNKDNSNAYVDLTVYAESKTDVADATGVTVELVDLHDDTYMYDYATDLTVAKAEGNKKNPYSTSYSSTAAVGCAQTYPTAGDALYSLMDANKVISFTQSGGYVDTISDVNGKTLSGYTSEDWTTYYGWYYCVMHRDGSDADFVEGSSVMSASVVPVESGDKVVWAFGTEDQTNEYFAEVLEQYQNGTV